MKRVLIMGASSGIGLRVAEAFASRGIKVGMAARHTETMRELKKKYPDNVEYMSIDVTHADAPDKMQNLIDKMGGMDIYFHVSGIGYENLKLDPQREVDIISTNAGGFVRMICTAYRYFRDNHRKGHIAAVTSVAGTNGIGRLSAYSASKKCAQTYLVALEQLANAEKADVTFTDIRPGWVKTPLLVPGLKYPMEMTLDYAVPLIIKAIVRRPRVAVIDWRWNIVVGLWRMIPNFIWTRVNMEISSPDKSLPAPGTKPFPSAAKEEKEARQV
jgi:short-subunit dehydrogenase